MAVTLSTFQNFLQKFSSARKNIDDLNLPLSSYLVIWKDHTSLEILERGYENDIHHKDLKNERNTKNVVISWIEKRALTNNTKFVAAEIVAEKWLKPIISDLWLKEDIVPFFKEQKKSTKKEHHLTSDYVQEISGRFDSQNIVGMDISETNEVNVAELVTLADYKAITSAAEMSLLQDLAKEFEGKKIIFINATPQGGGVALMRHALIRLFRLLGVDAHWHILVPSKEAFDITKTKFHNVLQAVADPATVLTDHDKDVYRSWSAQNAAQLKQGYTDADVVVIDDPQPSGMIDEIKKVNPKAKIIYRSHIQIVADLVNKKGTPQNVTWDFIWQYAKKADLFASHPIKEFVPKSMTFKKTVMMPATTDALDGLNKPLSPHQTDYYLKLFDRFLLESQQEPLDRTRPYIVQIARFDPSKGIPDLIEAYRLLRQKLSRTKTAIPQLVIAGHGSVDDPDGVPIYNLVMDMLKSDRYQDLASDVKVARLPHIDQILDALMWESTVALQLSHKEGFEVKVSEALMKGVPVVAYRSGGIPLQINDGKTGFLVKTGDVKEVAEKLYTLFTDSELYYKMCDLAREEYNPETTTVSNAINWLFLANELLNKGKLVGNGKNVKELIKKKYGYWR